MIKVNLDKIKMENRCSFGAISKYAGIKREKLQKIRKKGFISLRNAAKLEVFLRYYDVTRDDFPQDIPEFMIDRYNRIQYKIPDYSNISVDIDQDLKKGIYLNRENHTLPFLDKWHNMNLHDMPESELFIRRRRKAIFN